MSYFMHANEDDTKLFALKAIGSICIRHYDFMLCQDLMNTYLDILSNNDVANIMKSQVCIIVYSNIYLDLKKCYIFLLLSKYNIGQAQFILNPHK